MQHLRKTQWKLLAMQYIVCSSLSSWDWIDLAGFEAVARLQANRNVRPYWPNCLPSCYQNNEIVSSSRFPVKSVVAISLRLIIL